MEIKEERRVVLAYVRDGDFDLARIRFTPTPLQQDGRLELRRVPLKGDRLVVPRVFVGRQADGRLGFLCDVVGTRE